MPGGVKLATVGYEGSTLQNLITCLHEHGITVLIDVRDVPWSRRLEFTQKILIPKLEDAGLRYAHLPGLGNPEAGRDAAKRGDRAAFEQALYVRLKSSEGETALRTALSLMNEGPIALMCMEREADMCHRALVAAELATRAGGRVEHLKPLRQNADPRQGTLF